MVVAFERSRDGALLTTSQAATIAGVHRATVRQWCADGRLPSTRVNARGDLRIRRRDVEALIARARSVPARTPALSTTVRPAERPVAPLPERSAATRLRLVRDQVSRGEALRRIAAEVSGRLDLQAVFEDVLDYSQELFATSRVGLWLIEAGHHPFRLGAHRNLSDELREAIAGLTVNDRSAGMIAIERRELRVIDARDAVTPALVELYGRDGIRTICFVPIVFHDEPLGLLALYHETHRRWPSDELDLARAFADQMATAIKTARLYSSVSDQAARLQAIGDLGLRLNRISDVAGIGAAIVAELRSLIDCDTIRVYRVDRDSQMCEPIGFEGRFMGVTDPTPEMLAMRVGQGLTGWVAANGRPIVTGDGAADPRSVTVGKVNGPESMLVVPMLYDDEVRGVVVTSRESQNAFTSADEATLSVFAGYAALALANAESRGRVLDQQARLEQQLASQRRLLEVNERMLAARDPAAGLELIAEALKDLLSYDTLTIYSVDPTRTSRKAVVARGRYAEQILNTEAPLGVGLTGWVIDHAEPTRVDDALLDPRAIQVPGTPRTHEAKVVVPLVVDGLVIGTLDVARLGGDRARFSDQEFELTKLFAAQASIALGNAVAHRDAAARADRDPLTELGNHGAFQRAIRTAVEAATESTPFALLMLDLDGFKAFNDAFGHPAGDDLLRRIADGLRAAVAADDALYRYGGDEFAVLMPRAGRTEAFAAAERIRVAVAEIGGRHEEAQVTVSIGVARYPDDGGTGDLLVGAADRALYLAKPLRAPAAATADPRDAYLAALNETALALMDRLEPAQLLTTIIQRATALLRVPDGYIYLVDPDGEQMTVTHATGHYEEFLGFHLPRGEGLGWLVVETGRAQVVLDYDAWAQRASEMPKGRFGSLVAVPLTSGGQAIGVIGLSISEEHRKWLDREIAVLSRFAQLASIALDNARLLDAATSQLDERTRAEEALRASEERFRRLSDATREALAIHRDGVVVEVNAAFCRLLGVTPEQAVGRSALEFIAPESIPTLEGHMADPDAAFELLVLARDGSRVPVQVVSRAMPFAGGTARVVSMRDLRERREIEALTRQTRLDAVTGLPNKDELIDRLRAAIADDGPIGGPGRAFAFVLLDLDRFKLVNESLGHAAGDGLLTAVGERLRSTLRPEDLVARFGSDEFGILVTAVDTPDAARTFADRLAGSFAEPVSINGRETYVNASMGVVLAAPGMTTVDELLRDAEVALHRAKTDPALPWTLFEPSMSVDTLDRLELEGFLRHAQERNELRVHYQPIIELETGAIVGAEALVRWQHPSRGLMPPNAFIPLAEETGLIVPIGRWVLEAACRQAQAWRRTRGPKAGRSSARPFAVSVNLSARQFAAPELARDVATILRSTGLPAECLELEITESVLMTEIAAAERTLRELRALGVRIVLDDFGTGYSSLGYLRQLPLDAIKVDRSFVSELDTDPASESIVTAIVALARGLGVDVIAEGIETTGQRRRLRQLACDRGQGFLWSQPLPAEAFAELRKAWRSADR